MGDQDKDSDVYSASSKVNFDEAWHFILKVGLAAHKYGSTSTRLEYFLSSLSNEMGFQGVFKATPVEIVFGLRETPDSPQRVEVMATAPPNIDLDKLARLGELLNEIKEGSLSVSDAYDRIDQIDQVPPPWGKFASLLGYVFTGLGLAPLLGAGWTDTFVATVFSILVYGMVLLSARMGAITTSWINMPLSTALITGFLATLVKYWVPDLNLVLVILSAVAIILPGYSISLGVGELVAQHVLSGVSNLMSGLITLIKQIAGAIIGISIASLFVTTAATEPETPVNQMWVMLLFPLLLVGLGLAFQVSRRDFPWSVLLSGIAFLGVLGGTSLMDSNLGNLLGTIIAVVLANLWSRKTGRPTSIVLIPAIVMLVSGTIGFRGLAAMAEGELLLGVQQFLQMFIVAITILAGILIGFTIVRPEPNL
jgi:uncharacterized membrane protein YjjP (DUF1212 family)